VQLGSRSHPGPSRCGQKLDLLAPEPFRLDANKIFGQVFFIPIHVRIHECVDVFLIESFECGFKSDLSGSITLAYVL